MSCLSTGQCYLAHPELLRADEEDFPESLKPEFDKSERAALEDAVSICPNQALRLVD
jgi:ferredoxin